MGFPPAPSQAGDPLAVAFGLKSWNVEFGASSNSSAPTSQTIYTSAIWIPPGVTITGAALAVSAVAAGNKPTAFYVGLCSATKMLAQSGDLSGNAGAPFTATGGTKIAFSTTYQTNTTDSATGLYYVMLLQNGSYSVTNPSFGRGAGFAASTAILTHATAGTGQTALPANGAAVTLSTSGTPLAWYVGVY